MLQLSARVMGKISSSMLLHLLFVLQKRKESNIDKSVIGEIVAEADRLDIKDKGVLALSEVLFDKNMLEEIPKFRNLFLRVSSFVLNCYNALKISLWGFI